MYIVLLTNMTYLARGRNWNLKQIVLELGLEISPKSTLLDLKAIIIASKDYDGEFVRAMLEWTIKIGIRRYTYRSFESI